VDIEKLIPVKREVMLGEKSIEEVLIAELQKKPEDNKLSTGLEGLKVLSVETKENTAYVNFSSENLYGGSLQEMSVISQVVMTLTELPGIEQVQFLVDGSVRETLMGHDVIQEPIKRDDARL
jgi:spore germination protein GerM